MKTFPNIQNKIIEFTPEVEKDETMFDAGMRGRVTDYQIQHEDVVKITVDFSQFEEFNKQFEKATFYGKDGQANLKWSESPFYPNNKVEIIYVDLDIERWPLPFREVEEAELEDQQNNKLIFEMERFLPILERAEKNPKIWDELTQGLGIATINGYKNAIEKFKNKC
jgi:hypothetical protein